MMNNPNTKENCEKCLGGHYMNCLRGRCIHGSSARSAIGVMEALYWKTRKTYRYFDRIICCSDFLKHKFDTDPLLAAKTVAMHNFVKKTKVRKVEKKDYVLYFGRYSEEKGIGTLLEVCRSLPDIPFVFAGKGPLEDSVNAVPNIRNAGFQSGEELEMLIRQARFSIYPSEWYENCPFSVMESQMYGTPVIGAKIGGIPELIQDGKNGELFDSGNAADLAGRIRGLWENREQLKKYTEACSADVFDTVEEYCEKLVPVYEGTDIGA
jgi:glycosyltransferase involved in cell wall biosynthesis